ncbi:MAG: MBL fold metallo-hydrolase, partial [archaeon]
MKLTFCGAAKIVTGSCYLLEIGKKKYLVDCGMFQGEESEKNYQSFPFDPKKISAVFLTHAHIDHSGLLPKLKKHGFKGKIYATSATTDLCEVMLADSAHVQEMNAEEKNKERVKEGKKPIKPLYTSQDAHQTQKLFKKTPYDKKKKIDNNISIRFRDAGHIAGSAIIEVFIKESNSKNSKEKKLVFSGDLGQWNSLIVKNPSLIEDGDYVFVESTYGNRLHETEPKSLR